MNNECCLYILSKNLIESIIFIIAQLKIRQQTNKNWCARYTYNMHCPYIGPVAVWSWLWIVDDTTFNCRLPSCDCNQLITYHRKTAEEIASTWIIFSFCEMVQLRVARVARLYVLLFFVTSRAATCKRPLDVWQCVFACVPEHTPWWTNVSPLSSVQPSKRHYATQSINFHHVFCALFYVYSRERETVQRAFAEQLKYVHLITGSLNRYHFIYWWRICEERERDRQKCWRATRTNKDGIALLVWHANAKRCICLFIATEQ